MSIKKVDSHKMNIFGSAAGVMAITLTASLMCGCGSLVPMPELTDEQTELVTEYAAGLLLKHDMAAREGNLLDEEELARDEELEAQARERDRAAKAAAEEYLAKKAQASKDTDKDKNADDSDSNGSSKSSSEPTDEVVGDLASFYGMDGFSVAYKGYELTPTYPTSGEDMLMAMDATAGMQLCVLRFDVTNNSGSDALFDMFYRSPNFYLTVNGEPSVHHQYTLLLDDMAASNDQFAAGQTQERVLIFEISDTITDIGSMSLSARNADGVKGTMPIR